MSSKILAAELVLDHVEVLMGHHGEKSRRHGDEEEGCESEAVVGMTMFGPLTSCRVAACKL